MLHLLFMLIGYLVGCFQTAYIVGKIAGKIDIREHGSGNAGMTNVVRVMGAKAGAVVLLADVAKAALAVMLANYVFYGRAFGLEGIELLPGLLTGFGVVLGHNFPFYMGFKGGKGVASSIGALLMFDWRIVFVAAAIGIVALIITKYISVASLVAFLAFAVAVTIIYSQFEIILVAWVVAATGVFTHRTNIKRLIEGSESKFLSKKGKKP